MQSVYYTSTQIASGARRYHFVPGPNSGDSQFAAMEVSTARNSQRNVSRKSHRVMASQNERAFRRDRRFRFVPSDHRIRRWARNNFQSTVTPNDQGVALFVDRYRRILIKIHNTANNRTHCLPGGTVSLRERSRCCFATLGHRSGVSCIMQLAFGKQRSDSKENILLLFQNDINANDVLSNIGQRAVPGSDVPQGRRDSSRLVRTLQAIPGKKFGNPKFRSIFLQSVDCGLLCVYKKFKRAKRNIKSIQSVSEKGKIYWENISNTILNNKFFKIQIK